MSKMILLMLGWFCLGLIGQTAENEPRIEQNDLDRSEFGYRAHIERHRSIKSYLALPTTVKMEVEPLLAFLLENGFSIDDLSKAYFALRAPTGIPVNCPEVWAGMRLNGASEEQIQSFQERMKTKEVKTRREIVERLLGLNDPKFLDELLRFAPAGGEPIQNYSLPLLKPVVGEKILCDKDWMTPAHERLVSSYDGPPRRMFPKEMKQGEESAEPRAVLRSR